MRNIIYKSKVTGEYLQLLTERASGVNTYLQIDAEGNPIIKKRKWSVRPQEQRRIVRGFSALIKCELINSKFKEIQ